MKLSIITINRNNDNGLKKTIESVVCQTFKEFEYIIIDGASTDESTNIINEYSQHITYFVSERDDGIYYAMNKGIKVANGEYCLFLNSGDYLSSSSVLEKAFSHGFFEDIVYGDIVLENDLNQKSLRLCNRSLSIFHFCGLGDVLVTHHQSSFIKLSLFSRLGLYRTDLSITSDQVFFMKAIFEYGATYRYIPVIISIYDINGMSSQNKEKYQREFYNVSLELFKYTALRNSIKSIAFYDKVWNTPFVKSWYNFYNAADKLKFKVKRFFGKDFYYNNSKALSLKQLNKKFIPRKIRIPKNKKCLVWGTGADSILIYNYCNENKIFIYGFIDSNEIKQQYSFLGRPVFAPKYTFENKTQGFFIVIASRNYCEEISKTCKAAGLVEGKDFVVPFKDCHRRPE
ncbi:MAG: glycosyltransferase [Chitinispirillales bacterium]|jgi:glycosyltransferase involved in cell wall biosynthesis|nr:glycosyltransferase [Chitinispirillales bacterium]